MPSVDEIQKIAIKEMQRAFPKSQPWSVTVDTEFGGRLLRMQCDEYHVAYMAAEQAPEIVIRCDLRILTNDLKKRLTDTPNQRRHREIRESKERDLAFLNGS